MDERAEASALTEYFEGITVSANVVVRVSEWRASDMK